MKKVSTYIIIGLVLIALAGLFFAGYGYYPKRNPCPEIVSDTVYIHDTVWHEIHDAIPYYIVKRDTIIKYEIIYENIDSLAIIERWLYSYEIFDREWNDSLINVTIKDTIFQNIPIGNVFNYRILRPQTIINNVENKVTQYSSYIVGAVDLPLNAMKYSEIEAMYIWKYGMLGVGYTPEIKAISFKLGIPIIRFKK